QGRNRPWHLRRAEIARALHRPRRKGRGSSRLPGRRICRGAFREGWRRGSRQARRGLNSSRIIEIHLNRKELLGKKRAWYSRARISNLPVFGIILSSCSTPEYEMY